MRAAIATLVTVCLYGSATAVLAQTAYDPARTRYAVEGLALGARLSAERAAYREYRCSRSAQFELFSLCQKVRNDRERRGSYRVFESMLLSQKGDVSYISRYQEPAFFDPAEADGSIERYSREIGEAPRVMRVAERFAHVDGILALWGSATLEPLDQETLKLLEEGKSPKYALLIHLIGNLARSAKEGLPIYRVGGRAGLIWVAGFDQGGRGTLRFAAVDASELASAAEGLAVSPARAAQQPAPAAAPPPPPPYGAPITLEQAKKVMVGAESEAKKNNWNMVIVILDSGGNIVMLQRMDGAQLGSIDVAKEKAYSAVAFRRPTKAFDDALAQGGANLRILRLPGASPVEGGIPVVADGKVIGSVGVSGGTSAQDAQVARAGIDSMK